MERGSGSAFRKSILGTGDGRGREGAQWKASLGKDVNVRREDTCANNDAFVDR